MPVTITPNRWLDTVDACLEREVVKWTDNTPISVIRRILADNAIDRAIDANVIRFKDELIARFDTGVTINLALESLKQGKNKDFNL